MSKTQAEKLVNSNDFDELWANVETVDRINGEITYDLYVYNDGSKLAVSSDKKWVIK